MKNRFVRMGVIRKRKPERKITHTSAIRDDITKLLKKLETAKNKVKWLKIVCLSQTSLGIITVNTEEKEIMQMKEIIDVEGRKHKDKQPPYVVNSTNERKDT